jgi:hypothetical protein
MVKWDQLKSPLQLAEKLWSFEALELSPQQFEGLANRVWSASPGLQALWKLGGAMNDFLRRHPGKISVPPKLPRLLLASPRCNPRIIGLKLLKHISISDEALLKEILKALQRRREYERCGGLCELQYYIDTLVVRRVRKKTAMAKRVMHRLCELAERSRDGTERTIAAHKLDLLEDLLP